MISKELLSEVLGVFVYNLDFIQDNKQYFKFTSIEGSQDYQVDNINIYELAHKCKEWAFKRGYGVDSRYYKSQRESKASKYLDDYDFESYKCVVAHVCKNTNNNVTHHEEYNTEPEAIFKACEWILNEKR